MRKYRLIFLLCLNSFFGISQTIVDCAAGSENITYCYVNNDTTIFEYTSNNGFPLEITFNSGVVENNWDELLVFDSDGVTNLNVGLPYGFFGDVSGITYQSSGDTISFTVSSNDSFSCETGGYSPIDATVTCLACLIPTVEFTTIGDCAANPNTPEFFVEANITEFGSATYVQLVDNQGNPTQTTNTLGVLTFGPYAAGLSVVLELSTNDVNCSELSDPFTFICPLPPNDCSTIYAGPDVAFNCDNNTVVLEANFHTLGQNTNVYEITPLDSCPTAVVSGGSPTSLEVDDRWSDAIDLGFEFCFFGDTYSEIIVGANGGLSFNVSNANTSSGYAFNQEIPNNINQTLSSVNIFAAYHDVNPETCGDINYLLLGTAPNRQFIVNYNNICQFNCSTQQSTMQVVLYETTNNIDINVFEKPECTWNNGNSVIGIQNMTADVAFTPDVRNTGNWFVDETAPEFYRFSPGQSTNADYVFKWYDNNGIFIGDTKIITVNPTETTTYQASITYTQCVGPPVTLTDRVTVELTQTTLADSSFTLTPSCNGATANITGDSGGVFSFNPTPTDGAIINTTSGEITNAVSGETYTVQYSINLASTCSSVSIETVTIFNSVAINQPTDLNNCNNASSALFDLTSVNEQILNGTTGLTLTFYESAQHAEAGVNSISHPDTYTTTIPLTEIFIRVENDITGCYAVTTFNVKINESPMITVNNTKPFKVCPNATTPISIKTTADNFNPLDVTISWDLEGSIISGQESLTINNILEEGDYTITVTDNNSGCIYLETITVETLASCTIPQAISPNNDGLNDRFDLSSYNVESLEIFNRMGRKVYVKTNGYTNQWTGNSSSGDELPTGTYYYVMKYSGGQVKASYMYINR